MNSFRDIRDILLLSYYNNHLSDEEFALLYNAYESENPHFNYRSYEPFDLDKYNSDECKAEFRVEKADIPRLVQVLGLPATIICSQRSVCDSTEALCLLLKRMTYPCRYSDLIPHFPHPVSVLSLIANETMDYIYDNHAHLLTQWNHNLLSPMALQNYADAITNKGSPLENCFGFIDGTVRSICRPGQSQRIVYNGHKRVHALKFQSISLPNGLVGNLFGPVGMLWLVFFFLSIFFSNNMSLLLFILFKRDENTTLAC